MVWLDLHSQYIRSAGYDDQSMTMYVSIRGRGAMQVFYRVPAHIFHGFVGAVSKERFYLEHLKGKYQP